MNGPLLANPRITGLDRDRSVLRGLEFIYASTSKPKANGELRAAASLPNPNNFRIVYTVSDYTLYELRYVREDYSGVEFLLVTSHHRIFESDTNFLVEM